jgi:hypothetical protein
MRIGPGIAAFLLHVLSWALFLTGAMMVVLAVGSALDLGPKPGSPIMDVIGATICLVLALVVRSLAGRFEQEN